MRERFLAALRGLDLVTVPAQQGLQDQPKVLLIVDNQDAPHCRKNANLRRDRLQ